MSGVTETEVSPVDSVAQVLENYAGRGVFQGYSCGLTRRGKTTFKMRWHQDRLFEVVLDSYKKAMRLPLALPNVPADSSMYKEFKAFLRSRQSDALPDHRRIDENKVRIRSYNRDGNVSLSLRIMENDYDYCAQKLIHLVNEIYMVYLRQGIYRDYMIENFDLDPDQP